MYRTDTYPTTPRRATWVVAVAGIIAAAVLIGLLAFYALRSAAPSYIDNVGAQQRTNAQGQICAPRTGCTEPGTLSPTVVGR
jgi:hypothetical protein